MNSRLAVVALLIVPCACWPQILSAQQPAVEEGAKSRPVLRVYQVVDLLLPTPNYPYRGSELPTSGNLMAQSSNGGGAGPGGGFGSESGGPGGGFSPGYFGGSETSLRGGGSLTFGMEDLVGAITGVVAPDSWADMGGPGSIRILGSMLLVSQTEEVHRMIEHLLDEIRAQGGTVRTVTVAARWIALEESQRSQLLAARGERSPVVLERGALEKLPADALRYQGQVTCHSGQTVHVVSGVRHTVVTSATPVVGGPGTGYQPLVEFPNAGVLLQLTPLLLPDGKTASLDLQSSVTTWQPPDSLAVTTGETSLSIDRIRLAANQLVTTVRIPVGEPVLVGGLTMVDTDAPQKPLYLIVELTVNNEPPRQDARGK